MFVLLIAGLLSAAAACRADDGGTFPFHVGEKLTYQIYWGPFIAGDATLEVREIEVVDGHDCYHLVARAQTSGFVDWMFHVNSTTESWLDVKELCTRRYRQNRTEGKHTRRSETRYDYVHNQFTITNHITGARQILPLHHPVQDIVSALYYSRSQPLSHEKPQNFLVNAGDTNHVVHIQTDLHKTVWVSPLGNVPAFRIEPKPTITVVAANKGRMWVWISDNAQKIPLIMISTMKIGSVRFQLTEIHPPRTAPAPATRISRD